ncbi:hypothetical protein FGADI_9034 [Fusarium gaditjirri]|uniref:Ankyrin repeat protein n=1 Tax=Fusarium gaditjirri TaxID=282569 RepID=A0A8H4WSL2_9HYPO|nr:hypothetical protein FGADI_9034 [Fusarium gaditjirri]
MGLFILPRLIILATLFACVWADGLDDFTNNLFSDLGPILALFGERVTMQFMSQAMNWVDCIVLAMAPLGIITILVSAIRVGGPQWLKAAIGRARENLAAAEIELMSSTSDEICELFNGKGLIRCQGTAPIWEYICVIPKSDKPRKEMPLRFMTLEVALLNCLLTRKPEPEKVHPLDSDRGLNHQSTTADAAVESVLTPNAENATSGVWSASKHWLTCGILRQRCKNNPGNEEGRNVSMEASIDSQIETTEECITVIREITNIAPNISINLESTNLQKTNSEKTVGRTWINHVAVLGGLLQGGVLAFFAVMSYDARIQPDFQKDDKPAAAYGFPLAAGGTVLLVAGMFICGFVVENSTNEVFYKAKEDHHIRMYWIQQSQTVSDQVFESYAVFPKEDLHLSRIVKSTRHPDLSKAFEDGKGLTGLQLKTMIGVFIGLLGFIIQFTGLRAMNSAASLAQLGAVVIMTGCRALARPGFSMTFEKRKLFAGFELDWLAWKLVMAKENAPSSQGNGQSEPEGHPNVVEPPKPDKSIPGCWAVLRGEYAKYQALESLLKERKATKAHEVLVSRRELCKLAKFQGQTSKEAINLAIVIEEALGIIFPDGPQSTSGESFNSNALHNEDGEGFRWLMNVTVDSSALSNRSDQEAVNQVWFDLNYRDSSWHVLADSLDAALSLWVYTIRQREIQQSDKATEEKTKSVVEDNDEWLRRKVPQPCLRLMDPGKELKEQLLQDLEWWVPQSTEHLLEIEEAIDLSNGQAEPTYPKRFDATRVVGCRPSSASSTEAPQGGRKETILAIESRDPLERLYAKDLLFSFMCSAAKTAAEIPGTGIAGGVELRTAAAIDQATKVLWHKDLEKLAESFQSSGFGTYQESLISIIAPLSMAGILPFPHALLESKRDEVAEEWKLENDYDAASIYDELMTKIQRYASGNSGFYESILALLLEVQNDALCQVDQLMKPRKPIYRLMPEFEDRIKDSIEDSVEKWPVKPEFFCEFKRLFKKSGRVLSTDVSISTCNDRSGSDSHASHHGFDNNEFPAFFNINISHIRALEEGSLNKGDAHKRDFCGRSPLHYATMNDKNCKNLMDYFLKNPKDVDVNIKDHCGHTPLHYACALGAIGKAEILLYYQAKLDNQAIDGMYPMHLAARNGHVEVIKVILKTDARRRLESPQWRSTEKCHRLTDYNGYLPIHWGAITGNDAIIGPLKEDINKVSADIDTPLHLAVLHGKLDVVNALLELSAETEKQNNDGETALLLALYLGHLDIAEQLIKHDAEPNYVGRFGETPLHALFIRRYTKSDENLPEQNMRLIAEALVKKGAKLEAKNNDGHTPVDLARKLNLASIAQYFSGEQKNAARTR